MATFEKAKNILQNCQHNFSENSILHRYIVEESPLFLNKTSCFNETPYGIPTQKDLLFDHFRDHLDYMTRG